MGLHTRRRLWIPVGLAGALLWLSGLRMPGPGAVATAQQSPVYYVATNGDDSSPGTLARPWRTLQKAANALLAGDTVYVRGATYRERVVPEHSGSDATHPITYAAYPGEVVTLDGTGVAVPVGPA